MATSLIVANAARRLGRLAQQERRDRRRNGWATTVVLTVVAAGLVPPGVAAAEESAPTSVATDRQEQPVATRDGITVSHVSFRLPLPSGAPAHPDACDRTGFLRYRPADGPENSRDADAVVVQQQGLLGGAVNSDAVAANTVRSAKTLGRSVEFWALARRGSCLDDQTGFDAALQAGTTWTRSTTTSTASRSMDEPSRVSSIPRICRSWIRSASSGWCATSTR